MLKLFKAKSLKNNTKTGQGVGVGTGVRSADSKNAKKQKGRSMVEMLGVLAIIGVLSIGGISGYTIAMRKYQANEIVDYANKYATAIYNNCVMAMKNNPEEYYLTPISGGGYRPAGNLWRCPSTYYDWENSDIGLGPLPNGVDHIYHWNTYTTKRGDIVGIRIEFESKELCQTILSMTGGENSYTEDYATDIERKDYLEMGKSECEKGIMVMTFRVDG